MYMSRMDILSLWGAVAAEWENQDSLYNVLGPC